MQQSRFWIRFASHVAMPWLLYWFFAQPAFARPGSVADNPSLAILAHALMVAGAVVAFLGLNPISMPPLTSAQFHTRTSISLGLIEAGALVGIFAVAGPGHGDSARPFVLWATAANLLVVLPCAALRFKSL